MKKLKRIVLYENKGSDEIWYANDIDFHQFIDELCKQCNVEARKKSSRSSNKNLRDRFLKGLPPTKGSSNDYFFQAALQCNTDGLSESETLDKIMIVYNKWTNTEEYSVRPWGNIEVKIKEVYEKNLKIETGRPKGSTESGLDRTGIAQGMIEERKMYSDVESHEIFENQNGFLEKINDTLKRELQNKYPQMEQPDYHSILFKLEGLSDPIPPTNKDLYVFKNGVYSRSASTTIETEDIADMGFKDYNYLEPTKENEPKRFIDIIFDHVPKNAHPRIKAGLRAVLVNRLDPRISVIHGEPGTGKSTPLLILVSILGSYAMAVELDQLLQDKFIRAKIKGLRLLVLQDLPQVWKDFTQIKAMTGEQIKTERGFMQDSVMFENKLKIWGSGNYLSQIPLKEKNAMYSRRLSLVKKTQKEPYPENASLIDEVIKDEGEQIISWILNLPDVDCKYEDSNTVRKEWEEIASPEIKFLEDNYEISEIDSNGVSIMKIITHFQDKSGLIIEIPQMKKALELQGFVIRHNLIENIMVKT